MRTAVVALSGVVWMAAMAMAQNPAPLTYEVAPVQVAGQRGFGVSGDVWGRQTGRSAPPAGLTPGDDGGSASVFGQGADQEAYPTGLRLASLRQAIAASTNIAAASAA